MKLFHKTVLVLSVAFGLQVCNTTQENKQQNENKEAKTAQKGNFKDFDIDFKAHEFDVKEAYTLKHPTGSKLQIPANAFIDKNGKPIEGKIKVNYREFHHVTDIIASGITMEYDSAGKKHPFETAGMFDIRAEQNGETIFLAKDKQIKVDLASYKEGAFNFYYLREAKQPQKVAATVSFPFISNAIAQDVRPGENTWELLQTSGLPTENKERKEKLAEIEKKLPVQPSEPLPYDEKTPVFDLDIDTKDFPELRTFEGIVWQYAGDLEDAAKNPQKNEWIFDHQWTNIRLEDDGDMQYRLVLQSATKRFESQVRPALKGLAYEKAKAFFAEKKKQYEADLKQRKEEIESLRAEKSYYDRSAKFLRSFQIQNLGIYNCDRIYNDPETISITLNLAVPEDPSASNAPSSTVYLIMDRDVIQYSASKGKISDFKVNLKRANKLLVLFSNSDKVGVYSKEDFRALGQLKTGKAVQIDLKPIKESIKSTTALEDLIARL
jgi:hypothetical protein